MNRKELAQEIKHNMAALPITTAQIGLRLRSATGPVPERSRREPVKLRGFGTFKRTDRAARTSRNPKTGEPVAVPAKIVMTFKASTT